MQGSIWGSLCCVVVMDKLGKLVYNKPELLYRYKGLVGTPPLQMVDDILGVQKCNNKSLELNTVVNTFVSLEKLKLSKQKCNNIHVGARNMKCPPLKGTCTPNIEKRKQKGYSITSSILAIVNEVPLGHWKVQAGLSLRQAMLLNGILFNSEAWQGPDTKNIVLLEKVDEALLRGILGAHPKIPLEALYLETRSIPIRFIVASRRILYLHTILNKYGTRTGVAQLVCDQSSSIKGRLPSKVVFRQRPSYIKGSLPSKVVFRQRLSSVKGHLPSFEYSPCLQLPPFQSGDI